MGVSEAGVIDMLVLHYTGMEDAGSALARLCDPAAKVSAHYLIDEDGSVYHLVDEDKRAWHAGESYWRGHTDINARSIGIELVNPGHEFGYRPFSDPQMVALIELAQRIVTEYSIPAVNIVGHSDIAPVRKQDPGELFDWRRLAENGLGYWPDDRSQTPPSDISSSTMLSEIGYEIGDTEATIRAFQRRYVPGKIDGHADAVTVAALFNLYSQLFT